MAILEEIKEYEDEIIEIYKHLHQHPELGFEEYETSAFVQKKLADYGIEFKQIALTGVMATIYGGKPGKTVAIRADMDALPLSERAEVEYKSQTDGVMHACGHDAHVTMLLGAAKYFEEHKEELRGNVRLIFQPAEEGARQEVMDGLVAKGGDAGGGAATMIQDGALENVDMCFALHVVSHVPVGIFGINKGKAMASSDKFTVEICGKGGHGSSPDTAIDPIGALSGILAAYNQLPAREFSALDNCVVTVGTVNTDSSWNIIPDKVIITGNVRTFDSGIREKIFVRLPEIAENICRAYRCHSVFTRMKGYSPTINNDEVALKMAEVANQTFGEGTATVSTIPLMGSEDVGRYFEVVPGAMGWLGMRDENHDIVAAHNPNFRINLQGLKYGSLFHVNMAMNYLNENKE